MGKLSILCLCVLLLVSCQEEEGNLAADDRAVVFTCVPSDIAVHTRAKDAKWEVNDRVGIYMIGHTAFLSSFSLATLEAKDTNIAYEVTSWGTDKSDLKPVGNPLRYPTNDDPVNFVAYYPYKSNLVSGIYPVNVGDASPENKQPSTPLIDLIYHKDENDKDSYKRTTAPTVSLEFRHKLSKLIITLERSDSETTDFTDNPSLAIIGMPNTANFNLASGALSDWGDNDMEIHPDASTTPTETKASWEAIIIPHTKEHAQTGGRIFEFSFGTGTGIETHKHTLDANFEFKEGEAYEYKFKWTSNGVTLISQNTLMDWEGTLAWEAGKHYLTIDKTEVNLDAYGGPITPNDESVIKIRTKDIEKDEIEISKKPDADWLTLGDIEDGPEVAGEWKSYTLRFTAAQNGDVNTQKSPRKSSILIGVKDLTLEVTVNQSRHGLYVKRESPLKENIDIPLPAGTCSFTVRSNAKGDGGTNHQAPALKVSTTGVLKDAIAIETLPELFWFKKGKKPTVEESVAVTADWKYTFNFDYTANTPDKDRELYVHVIAEDDDATALRYKVTQSTLTAQPKTTVADGMSNCYMVEPGGSVSFRLSRAYKFDIDKGAFTDELHIIGDSYNGLFEAEVVWQDVGNLITNLVPTPGYYGPNAQMTVFTNNLKGNAVVKIFRQGDTTETTVWSYHIWVTDYEPNDKDDINEANTNVTFVNDKNNNDLGNTNYIFLNRDLGALKNNKDGKGGLYYQWGRKDPFSPDHLIKVNTKATITETIKNPNTFYYETPWIDDYDGSWNPWGDRIKKSIYDPCPSGWKLPFNTEAWAGLTSSNDDPNSVWGPNGAFKGSFFDHTKWKPNENVTYYHVIGTPNNGNNSVKAKVTNGTWEEWTSATKTLGCLVRCVKEKP